MRLLILILVLWSYSSTAQEYFSSIYPYEPADTSILARRGYFLGICKTKNELVLLNSGLFYKNSYTGNLNFKVIDKSYEIKKDIYAPKSDSIAWNLYTGNFARLNDSILITSRNISNTYNFIPKVEIVYFNINSGNINFKEIPPPTWKFKEIYNLDIIGKNLYLTGYVDSPGYNGIAGTLSKALYVIKTDLEGNLIWQRIYNVNYSTNNCKGIILTKEGNLLLPAHMDLFKCDGTDSTCSGYNALLTIDTNGNILNKKFLFNNKATRYNAIANDGYTLCMVNNTFAGLNALSSASNMRITKIDENQNIVRDTTIIVTKNKAGFFFGWNINVLDKNRILILGEGSDRIDSITKKYWQYGFAMLLDSNLNVKWTAKVKYDTLIENDYTVLEDACLMDDGKIWCVGTSNAVKGEQAPYLVVLDTFGCQQVCFIPPAPLPIDKIVIAPNPTQSQVSISLPKPKGALFTIV